MSDALQQLKGVKVEPSLRQFQNGAVGSIEMLSSGFFGIISAFKGEMEKAREIEERMDRAREEISGLQGELQSVNERCSALSEQLGSEMKRVRKQLQDQWVETESKVEALRGQLSARCDEVRQECLDSVQAISDKVGKSLENVDRLKEQFENLEQETNDQLRGLSMRCEENKEAIEEQDSKFKDQLNDLTEILHAKALELDTKIEKCLEETTQRITQFDEKQQVFQFETNKELAQKADLEDLKHKLDVSKFDEFKAIYRSFQEQQEELIQSVEGKLEGQSAEQRATADRLSSSNAQHDEFEVVTNERIDALQIAVENPVDVEAIKQEICGQVAAEQEAFKEEVMALVKQAAAGVSNPSSVGTRSGNCIACGQSTSAFPAMKVRSPSPTKKPKHGGGFNRMPSRRKSMDLGQFGSHSGNGEESRNLQSPKSPTARRSSASYVADLHDTSPSKRAAASLLRKAGMKVLVQDDPVSIPSVHNDH